MKNTGRSTANCSNREAIIQGTLRERELLFTGMKKLLLVTLALIAASGSHSAQVLGGKILARPVLLVPSAGPSEPLTVGIRFVLEPGWYLYWKNPGDSGLPVDVQWELPEGWKASALRFPVPAKFEYDGMISYGYKKEVMFLATLTPGQEPLSSLKASLDWLICKESCIRGSAVVEGVVGSSNADAERALADAVTDLPLPMSALRLSLKNATVTRDAEEWMAEIELEGSDASQLTDFYPELTDQVLVDLASIRLEAGVLRFRFEAQGGEAEVIRIPGLLIAGGRGYETTIPIQLPS